MIYTYFSHPLEISLIITKKNFTKKNIFWLLIKNQIKECYLLYTFIILTYYSIDFDSSNVNYLIQNELYIVNNVVLYKIF